MIFARKHDEENDVQYKGNALLRMLHYVKPHWKTVLLCFALVLAITALDLYKPILIGDAIDQYITQESVTDTVDVSAMTAAELTAYQDARFAGVLRTAGLYLLCLGALFVLNRAQFLLLQNMGQSVIFTIRNELFAHIEKLTMRFFDTTPVGKIVTRVTNDVESVNDLYANILVNLFKNMVKIVGLAAIMLSLNVRMALYSFVTIPVVMVLTIIFRQMSRRAYQMTTTRRTRLNTFLSENLSGMKVIQVFNREKAKYDEFSEKSDSLYKASYREMMVFAIFRPCIYMLSVVALVIVQGGGAASVLTDVISLGTLYVFIQYVQQFFQPIESLAEQFSTLQSAIASAEKIFTLLDTEPAIREQAEPRQLAQVRGRIEFDHVWFAYKDEDWVLRDVSFTIKPGQRVAFVGATGAGKSSILNLIGRYYDIQKGEIRIDGVNIKELDRSQIRAAIGQVQQDVFIFTGTIRSNISLRSDSMTDAQIEDAARHVNASRFIEKLENGYDEHVSERGATFSAGQRQLLSFARTLAYDPTILILDEATANIDTETEQWIQEALETLMKGRTTIMVAHRLSTIQHADKIVVMHHGKIRESGTHQQLLDMNGIYKKLYQLQLHEQG